MSIRPSNSVQAQQSRKGQTGYVDGEQCLFPAELDGPEIFEEEHRPFNLDHGLVDENVFADAQVRNPGLADWIGSQLGLVVQVACVVFFIISDASRTVINEWALKDAAIVQQSIVVAMAGSSIVLGSILALSIEGLPGLKSALSPSEACRFLPVSAVFSIGQTCQIYAYSFGITAVENTVIGYFYMPLSAVLSRFIFKRYYSGLEWLALFLLMLCATTFVLMQVKKDSTSQGLNVVGVAFVCGSVAFSCLGSVLAEKFMKHGTASFHVQKVQLEIGDLLMASVMLLVTGFASKRPKDAFWKERPVGTPDDMHMEKGVFAGWNWKILVVLAATLMQSWLGGLVAKQLSTVIRAVAQCLSLLLIYFVGDLYLKGLPFDWPQGAMAIVVALTVQVFVQATPKKPPPTPNDEEKEEDEDEVELSRRISSPETTPRLPPACPGDSFENPTGNPAAVPLASAC